MTDPTNGGDAPSDEARAAHAAGPPPGWYPDPGGSPGPRWWDGRAWGAHAPPAAVQPGPLRRYAEERTSAQRARTMLWVGAIAQATSAVLSGFTFHYAWAGMIDAFDQASRGRTVLTPYTYPDWYAPVSLVSNIAGLAFIVAGVTFLVWFHRSVGNAGALGLRQRVSPALAVVFFLVPFVNYVMPYLCAVDLFPPGSPDRRLVVRWWALFLSASFLAIGVSVASVIAIPAGVVVGVIDGVLWFAAALAARQLIARVLEVHEEMAGAAGSWWPAGPPAALAGPPMTAGDARARSPYGPGGPAGPPVSSPPFAPPPARPPGEIPDPWSREG